MGAMKATEHQEQKALIRWFDLQYPAYRGRLFAIPNGGQRHVVVAKKLKAEGVRKGVPDLMLPVPMNGFHGLFIEIKAIGGRMTPEQREWSQWLADQGYMTVLAVGFDSARRWVEDYLKSNNH